MLDSGVGKMVLDSGVGRMVVRFQCSEDGVRMLVLGRWC